MSRATTDSSERDRLVWGWLRLFLGICQTTLAPAALVLLLTLGPQPITFAVAIAGLAATATSIALFRLRSAPKSDDKSEGSQT